MIKPPRVLLTLLTCAFLLGACASPLATDLPIPATETDTTPITGSPLTAWVPAPWSTWQVQYTGTIDTSLDVDIYNLDLFETSPATIADLHARGIKVICYFSAGTYEDWRPDAASFPAALLGNDLEDWPGEKWLDIRNLQVLAPIIFQRIGLAAQKGCDGVDPDNVDGFTNNTGFPLTAEDQLAYNIFLANAAHQNGLGIGLKNDLSQIPMLVSYFDWATNEECFTYNECHLLQPFVDASKAVFVIEYQTSPDVFCPQANQMGFMALHKNINLDSYRTACQ